MQARTKRAITAATVFGPVALLYLAGALEFLERRWIETRFRLDSRPLRSEVVLVDIDPASLHALATWPWPRGYHATVIERLLEAGAERVAVDIDFSSYSDPQEDAELAQVLTRWRDRVVLPVFQQSAGEGQPPLAILEPIPALRQGARLGSINVHADSDGVVRRYRGRVPLGDGTVPSFAAALSADPAYSPGESYLDFGIQVQAVPRISYVDVLNARFDPAAVRGRPVIVGSTAIEVGDQLAVPVHGVLAGPLLQALAFESRHQGRTLHRSGAVVTLAIVLLLVVFLGPVCDSASWRFGLILTIGSSLGALLVSAVIQRLAPLIVETVPCVLALVGVYGRALVTRIEQQAVGLQTQHQEIQRTESLMRHIVENSFDAIVTVDPEGRVQTFNRSAEKMFRLRGAKVVGRPIRELVHHPDPSVAKSLFVRAKAAPIEAVGRASDEQEFPVEVVVTAIDTGESSRFVAFLRDISERKAQQEQLRHQATHDPLTGLPNRFLLEEHIQEALVSASTGAETVAVLMLDLDRFKEINDALGHTTGDALLKRVAERLRDPLEPPVSIARLGGDEFAVLLPATTLERALQTAWRLIEGLRAPFEIDGLSLQVDTSLGITLYPDHGHDAETLLQRADVAMYVAKRKRSNLAVYRPEQDFNSKRHLMLRADLRHAIHEDQLLLVYQPKVLAETDRIVGAEALVRWKHPEHGLIAPDEFIALAEHCGMIRGLTQRVLENAVRQLWQWQNDGIRLSVSVNLSARNLLEEDLPHTLTRLLARYQVPAELLTLEITESVIMEDPERALTVVTRLEKIGVSISIDDFGMGYSSLSYLMRLPAREIKIDRSFVMKMESDPASATIVRSTIELAHNLGLEVVAEGVETKQVWQRLKELGCDIGQGYHFSRPVSPTGLVELLRSDAGSPLTVAAATPADHALSTSTIVDA